MNGKNIILEGHCTYRTDRKIPKSKRPSWCKAKNKRKIPQYKCLKSSCAFFAYTDAPPSQYILYSMSGKGGVK